MSKGDKKTGRRKKKWIKIAVPIAVVLVVVLFVKNSMKGASAGIPCVYTDSVRRRYRHAVKRQRKSNGGGGDHLLCTCKRKNRGD